MGRIFFILTIIFNIFFQGVIIGTNFWLTKWVTDKNYYQNDKVDKKIRNKYLTVYGLLGIIQGNIYYVKI